MYWTSFFGRHGGHHGRYFGGGRDCGDGAGPGFGGGRGRRLEAVALGLGLDAAQRARLDDLLTLARQLRRDARGGLLDGVGSLFDGDTLDRAQAERVLNEQLDRGRAELPKLIAAAGDFFDGLDAEQRAALRFGLRAARRLRGGR